MLSGIVQRSRRSILTTGSRCLSTSKDIFNVEVTSDGIAVIRMDDPNAKVNTLNEEFQKQVRGVIENIQNDDSIRYVLLYNNNNNIINNNNNNITVLQYYYLENRTITSQVRILK